MQLQQLRYIKKTAEIGNISAAAKELFISQPSLSQQIINLEKELGTTLFIRHSKHVSLTPAGEEFVIYATRILNDADTLTENMGKYKALKRGSLKVGLLLIAGYLGIPSVINRFQQQHPNLDISLKIDVSNTLEDMLLTREIDAAFVIGSRNTLNNKELYCQKIMDDRYVAVISRQNPLSEKDVIVASDLIHEKIIFPSPNSSNRNDVEDMFLGDHIQPYILCETSQSDIVIQLVRQNLGVGFFSKSIASSLRTKDVTIIPLKQKITRPIYYVTLSELLSYPTIRAFTEYISGVEFS